MTPPPRYQISHTSHYTYNHNVVASFNEARLTPKLVPWQAPLEFQLHVEPSTYQHRYTDYWGTQVRVFEAIAPHRSLDIRAVSMVEVDASRRKRPDPVDWATVRSREVTDKHCEYLAQTPLTEPPADLAELAADIAAQQSPQDTAGEICAVVHEALSYIPGSTQVQSPAAQAWGSRSGVCQDYAHLVVGALRHVGLPSRYVSGYLHSAADPQPNETAVGESHAWVEFWVGGWMAFDPTNSVPVENRHILVGTGRDYSDVPPIKGIVAGAGTSVLDVHVEITRVA